MKDLPAHHIDDRTQMIAKAAFEFGKFEVKYTSSTDAARGAPAINTLFCVYAVIGEMVQAGRISPELGEVIHVLESTFAETQKAD